MSSRKRAKPNKNAQKSPKKKAATNTTSKKAKISKAYPTKRKPRSLSFSHIAILFVIRISSALLNPIADCDETYNYWEPTAFLLTKYGLQTWEYAPQFALRSYSYLLPQYFVGQFLAALTNNNQVIIFYGIRIFLCLICAFCELFFATSLKTWFGRKTVSATFAFMTFSSGMFNCCAAYLPQQFVLCFILLSFGSFFREYRILAILFMGIAVIFGWPFIALLAVPMAMDCIFVLGLSVFAMYVVSFGAVLCGICIAIDYVFYQQILLAPLNIFLYNLSITNEDSDSELEGQNLYGTEDWTFYVKNLLFNWNIIYLLALLSFIACNVLFLMFFNRKKKSKNRGRRAKGIRCCAALPHLCKIGSNNNSAIVARLLHCISPFWIWFLFFTFMPHKEERFMFVIYPFIALNAALTLTQFRLWKVDSFNVNIIKFIASKINVVVVAVFIVLCASRSIGQVIYYRAPLDIWYKAGKYIANEMEMDKNICVGMEWYRIPSSLFVSNVANIKWMESGFDGELPAEFEGTYFVNKPFNDENKMEQSRFVKNVDDACDYIVDLWQSNKVIKEYDVSNYKVIEKIAFLDRDATSAGIFRSFYVPLLSDRKVVYAKYVFLKRKYDME